MSAPKNTRQWWLLESVGWLSGRLRACGARLGQENGIPILRILAELASSEVSCSFGFRLKSLSLGKMIVSKVYCATVGGPLEACQHQWAGTMDSGVPVQATSGLRRAIPEFCSCAMPRDCLIWLDGRINDY